MYKVPLKSDIGQKLVSPLGSADPLMLGKAASLGASTLGQCLHGDTSGTGSYEYSIPACADVDYIPVSTGVL